MHNLIDAQTHDPVILAEQCLALANAITQVDEAAIKESLNFILQEKVEVLLETLNKEIKE